MKKNIKTNKNSEYKKMTKISLKNEIKENGFKLSFGLSIIFVGILSLFFNISNLVIIGVSISSLLFAIIDALPKKNNLLYFFPLSILLISCIFSNMPFINFFLTSKLNNFIVFASFGLTICLYSYVSYRNRIKSLALKYKENVKYKDKIINRLENSIIILESSIKIRNICIEKKYNDKELHKEITLLEKFAQQEKILASVSNELVNLSISKNNSELSIDEFEQKLIKEGDFIRNKIDTK